MVESIQHKLDRVRPPRVQITYDVEIGDAIEMKELPFVVGILADLSGHLVDPLPPLKERKFVEIDRDNFPEVLESIKPEFNKFADLLSKTRIKLEQASQSISDAEKRTKTIQQKLARAATSSIDSKDDTYLIE